GGEHRSVLICGEPGIGKSRLADVHRRFVADSGGSTIAGAGSRYQTATHLYVARRLVESACGLHHEITPQQALERFREGMSGLGLDDRLSFLAALLDLPPQP